MGRQRGTWTDNISKEGFELVFDMIGVEESQTIEIQAKLTDLQWARWEALQGSMNHIQHPAT